MSGADATLDGGDPLVRVPESINDRKQHLTPKRWDQVVLIVLNVGDQPIEPAIPRRVTMPNSAK